MAFVGHHYRSTRCRNDVIDPDVVQVRWKPSILTWSNQVDTSTTDIICLNMRALKQAQIHPWYRDVAVAGGYVIMQDNAEI